MTCCCLDIQPARPINKNSNGSPFIVKIGLNRLRLAVQSIADTLLRIDFGHPTADDLGPAGVSKVFLYGGEEPSFGFGVTL